MNLAVRDIRHDLGRFLLTTLGLGLLLAIVLAMTGIYNGMIVDATTLPDALGAELWVVQRDTRGPFAEASRIPRELEDRALVVPGVRRARSYVSQTLQKDRPAGGKLRFTAVGLAWPEDRGEWLPLVEGCRIHDPRFEMIADRSLGLALGERIELGRDVYRVVGLSEGMVSSGGDPLAFLTVADVQRIQNDLANEAIRLEREARTVRVRTSELGRDPENVRRAAGASAGIPALPLPSVAAVLLDLAPGADPEAVRRIIGGWPDVTVYTAEEERQLLLRGVIERASRQIGLFRLLLVLISAILMSLIIYTMTLDKLLSIALLKLLGARPRVIFGMILEESLLLGTLAYGVALAFGALTFHHFPRRIALENEHRMALFGVVLAVSAAASAVGIRKALAADPKEVLAA